MTWQNDEADVLLKIPNKLLITPYHVASHEFSKGIPYSQIF